MRRSDVDAEQIDQTIIGHARQAGNGPNTGRQVRVRAGVPVEVSAYNVNIACGSGMKAIQLGAQQIALGDSEVVLAGGMENMTRVPFLLPDMRLGHRLGDTEALDAMYSDGLLDPLCGLIMGETAENLVDRYGISREEQDAFALESQQKAAASAEGRDRRRCSRSRRRSGGRPSRSRRRARPTRHDDGVAREAPAGVPRRTAASRPATRAASPTARPRWCSMSEARAKAEGRDAARARSPRCRWAGVPPEIMGIGPVPATQKVLERTGLHDRRHRPDRDQRGVRGAGDRVRARAEVRPRQAEREAAAASRSGIRSA